MSSSHLSHWCPSWAAPPAPSPRGLRATVRAIEARISRCAWVIDVLLVAIASVASMMLVTDMTAIALDKLELLAENDFAKAVTVQQDPDIAILACAVVLPAALVLVSRKFRAVVKSS